MFAKPRFIINFEWKENGNCVPARQISSMKWFGPSTNWALYQQQENSVLTLVLLVFQHWWKGADLLVYAKLQLCYYEHMVE